MTWTDQPAAACFEVFRSPDAGFSPGTGTYVATVSTNRYYDPTVKRGLTRTYHYSVRAAQAGNKSRFPAPVAAVAGLPADTTAPAPPMLAGQALHATKVTLSWLPVSDNQAVKGYKVYRDGVQIADVAAAFNSWMDNAIKPNTAYRYTVKAYDVAGNLSPESPPAMLKTQ